MIDGSANITSGTWLQAVVGLKFTPPPQKEQEASTRDLALEHHIAEQSMEQFTIEVI